jgi:acyl dehydratase
MGKMINPLPPVSLAGLLRGALRRRSGVGFSGGGRTETRYRTTAPDALQLAAYCAVLGFPRGAAPVTSHYLLAQRAHVAAMVDPAFPFRLAGMIHVENAITELSPLDAGRDMDIFNALTIEPPTESGARYCSFETLAMQDGKPVFRCESRYLALRGERRPKLKPAADAAPGEPLGSWHLPPDAGRRYAKASGDWNPIHLWSWSARLMGLEQPIIHGMHSVGMACALLERASGRRVTALQARFLAPVALGSAARLEADWQQQRYYVLCRDRLAVEGSFVVL